MAHQAALIPRLAKAEAHALWEQMLKKATQLGLTKPDIRTFVIRFGILIVSLIGSLAGAWLSVSTLGSLAACVMVAICMAQWAFLAHDAGHGSVLPRRWQNRLVGELAMTVVAGLAFEEWYSRHKTHHQHCQDERKDPDMDVSLVASLTANSLRSKGRLGLMLTRFQFAHIWLLTLLFGHSQRHLSQVGALKKAGNFSLDLEFLLLHIGLWWGLPLLVLNVELSRVVMVYIIPATLLGPYLAGIFWVNHIGMPLVEQTENLSFLEHQALTSRTILAHRRLDWVFGGLNYQIEHHLYPQIPSYRLNQCQKLVEHELRAVGLPYHRYSYAQAVAEIGTHFRTISRLANESSR